KQLYIPKGYAHGFMTTCENAEIQHKVDEVYSKEHDRSVRYNDPDIGVNWESNDIIFPILSDKDKNAPLLKDADVKF
ncbi:MAG: dTDP-4-dehydrorhamnose 3,5-epimerase, partial [Oscillospiraceae bacterium]|nr:dTDP-4-dehydrorhamnose 3,5-epimerase [Oscillospiraceae bacterium]